MRNFMNAFEGVEHASWPREISPHQLVQWMAENHHTEEDLSDGDLNDRVWQFQSYQLQRVPLASLDLTEFNVFDDMVDDYETQLHLSEAPPIVYDPVNGSIIDGSHRANAAKAAGRNDILAYVGDANTYEEISEVIGESVDPATIPTLYHATPMYRYDPNQAAEVGVWPNGQPIATHGLIPSHASHLHEASIYLSDSAELCANYAANNFGEEYLVDWVVLSIDPSGIDPSFLRSDLHQEADIHYEEILALGFSDEDWDNGTIPWWATLHATGQCRYTKVIPASAIKPVRKV